MGGARMGAQGVRLLGRATGSFGALEALSSVAELGRTYRALLREARRLRPRVAVLIDFPGFNFRLARALRPLGMKVLYYVGPQVWAWRPGRTRALASLADALALVLPFEERLYEGTGLWAEFVGHPLMDAMLQAGDITPQALGLEPGRVTVAVLPGSRPSELRRLGPVMARAARTLAERHPQWQFVLPLAPGLPPEAPGLRRLLEAGVQLAEHPAHQVLRAADVAMVASGTATLEAALAGTPMVVLYRMNPLSYALARLLVRGVRHISLPNILAQREVVKELLQGAARPRAVVEEVERLMLDEPYRAQVLRAFQGIRELFQGRRATRRVAQMVEALLG